MRRSSIKKLQTILKKDIAISGDATLSIIRWRNDAFTLVSPKATFIVSRSIPRDSDTISETACNHTENIKGCPIFGQPFLASTKKWQEPRDGRSITAAFYWFWRDGYHDSHD